MNTPRPAVRLLAVLLACTALSFVLAPGADASSHREAPFITQKPKVDGTDFYMFRSYEPGREDFVTLVANYVPLQDAYGGPNYFQLDPEALYEIHIDNNGDALEDLTFQFRFQTTPRNITIPVGNPGEERQIAIPLVNAGPFGAGDDANLNVLENYTLTLVRGDRRTGTAQPITHDGGQTTFTKPHDYIGTKSIPNYDAYANQFITDIDLPGSPVQGRVFVGQRKDPFVINLGETFDLVNTNPLGPVDGEQDVLADKNVTALILELPIAFLTAGDPVIGAWTTASKRQAQVLNPEPGEDEKPAIEGGAFTQLSRLSSPLVNEVVIGLKDKDRFNASEPKDDAQFADYVTHPSFPELVEILFAVPAPNLFPRTDLVSVFLTGVDGLNQPSGVVPSEMMRLNTAIDPTPRGSQSPLGVLGSDLAGYPNGRRPGDDIVDITIRAAMGVLLPPADAPAGQLPYTDGALVTDQLFDGTFPYLCTPLPGSPSDFVPPSK